MKKKIIAASIALVAAIALAVALLTRPQRDVFPTDAASARRAALQTIRRQGLHAEDNQLESIPTGGTWLADRWVFGIVNPEQPLLGGPRYKGMYLVGPTVVPRRELGVQSFSVTTGFSSAFEWLLNQRAPATESEALDIATCYAWLATHTRPDKLQVLGTTEVVPTLVARLSESNPALAASVREQIVAPRISRHRVATLDTPLFTVEICTYSPDFWGDIYFWHVEIGKHVFSVSRRPIHLAPRVLE